MVVAGYANDFGGYVTTWHEYQLQQYEGGHTLFGPWSEAAYRQEFVRLARALKNGETVASSVEPADMRTRPHRTTLLDGPEEHAPHDASWGDVVVPPRDQYTPGEEVAVSFWTGSPVNEYSRQDQFMAVEKLDPATNTWSVVHDDRDWCTTAQWQRVASSDERAGRGRPSERTGILDLAPPRYATSPDPFQVSVCWETEENTPAGTYRLVHYGRVKESDGVRRFTAASPAFEIQAQ